MICVSIGRGRHKMMILEHRALAEKGAELVELRIDWLPRPELTRLLSDRPTPVIVTCRRAEECGRFSGSEDQRLALLRSAIVEGVEYVDLEDDIASRIPRYGDTKRIISHHNFQETPDDLEEIHRSMTQLDPDIVKIVTMANSAADVVRMLRLVKNATVPTVGFCMGELGVPSRILCGKYGAPFTYATFNKEREMAPGQLSFDEMTKLYRYNDITADTQVYGVLGDPIAHSLSPLIHNSAFHDQEIDAVYLPLRVLEGTLTESLQELEWLDIRGYSVTIPHKETVLRKQAIADDAVKTIGAANTLYRNEQNEWRTTNTDYAAALNSMKASLKAAERDDSLMGKQVVILGAGGVARAIGLGLVKSGAKVTLANRNKHRAQALAEELGCQFVLWENRATVLADILVNCTPVGMHPDVDNTPYAGNWLREGMLVFDTIYNPERTLLLKEAAERSCLVVSGLDMFVRQAAAQFELFTGHAASLEQMSNTLRKGISAVKHA